MANGGHTDLGFFLNPQNQRLLYVKPTAAGSWSVLPQQQCPQEAVSPLGTSWCHPAGHQQGHVQYVGLSTCNSTGRGLCSAGWMAQLLHRCPVGLSTCPWISTTRKAFFMPSSSSAARHSGVTAFAFKCLALLYSYLQCPFRLSQQCKSRLIPLKFMELRQCKTD